MYLVLRTITFDTRFVHNLIVHPTAYWYNYLVPTFTRILEIFRKCFYCIFICLGRSGIGKSPVKNFLPPPPRNFRYTKGVSLGNPRYRAIGPGNCCYRAGWPGNNCHVGCVAVITGPGGPVIAATWIARKFFPKLAARARV